VKDRTRRRLMLLAVFGVIASASSLVVLRTGRPLFYSDGEKSLLATDLSHASMLVWGRPEPVLEIPGPIRGRVQIMPDGHLLYGRVLDKNSTNLVFFDPNRPDLEPVPIGYLNSKGHDLAPVLSLDNRLYFSSDRSGGSGGFDIYSARYIQGQFVRIERLPDGINTPLDETDPAPDPRSDNLVYIQRNPALAAGRNGVLMTASLEAEAKGSPLFPLVKQDILPFHRDPIFDPGGMNLWYVGLEKGGLPALLRTWRHKGEFLPARRATDLTLAGPFRSPLFGRDKFTLNLVKPGNPAILYRVESSEVFPWWQGQERLETILFSFFIGASLLFLLLYLGQTWRQLDLVTQCLLLSLLLHLLLLLWFTRVQIVRRFIPEKVVGNRIEVQLLARHQGITGSRSQVGQEISFKPHKQKISAVVPLADATSAKGGGSRLKRPEKPLLGSKSKQNNITLQDLIKDAPKRSGRDRVIPLESQETVAEQDLPDRKELSTKSDLAQNSFQVVLPPTAPAPSTRGSLKEQIPDSMSIPGLPQKGRKSWAPPPPQLADSDGKATLGRTGSGEPAKLELKPLIGAIPVEKETLNLFPEIRPSGVATGKKSFTPPKGPSSFLSMVGPSGSSRGHSFVSKSSKIRKYDRAPTLKDRVTLAPAVMDKKEVAGLPALSTMEQSIPGPALFSISGKKSRSSSSITVKPQSTGFLAKSSGKDPLLRSAPELAPGHMEAPVASLQDQPAKEERSRPESASPEMLNPISPSISDQRELSVPSVKPVVSTLPPIRLQLPRSALARVSYQQVGKRATRPDQLTFYSNRFGPRKVAALEKFGGTRETERAVRKGLEYLSGIQNRDGSWGKRSKWDRKYGRVQIGKTALCLLSFLGAGHTPKGDSIYSTVTERAITFLLTSQDEESGHFGQTSSYSHGITTYALAECFAMTSQAGLRKPLTKAINQILRQQNWRRDRRNRGGWGYYSPNLRPEDRYSRTSITSWMVMALESARRGGIHVPKDRLAGAV